MSFKDFLQNSSSRTVKAAKEEAKAELPPKRTLEILPKPSFYINKLPLITSIPESTRRWIRDASDERAAVEYGCRFDEAKGQYVVNWIESNCILYEGDCAGQLMSVEDWQFELFMQGWGWQWFSHEWARRLGKEDKGWVRRFRKISGWVPKKNTKSPTLAAAGLYTLIADGEPGQKCFSVATDIKQAEIAHTHAKQFVEQNPRLASVCRINKTTNTIHFGNCQYSIRTGQSTGTNLNKNEGLNGSLFIDETHVVDEILMSVLKGAGISRRQFLLLQLSTAGFNLSGYGHKECLAGRENIQAAENGLSFDFRSKHLEFGISEDVTLDDLRDPEKIEIYVVQSNPTLGRIVMHDEIIQTWEGVKHSDSELSKFAMYRLNQWNSAAGGVYVSGGEWAKCYKKFLTRKMREFPCAIGGDFSKRRDMCSIVLGWAVPTTIHVPVDPDDPDCVELTEVEINVPHILPKFLLPRRAVERYARKINLQAYADAGYLTIVESKTIRASSISKVINWAGENFDVRKVGHDGYYGLEVETDLINTYGWDEEMFCRIGQSNANIGPAVEQLYNIIINEEFVHNGNEVMSWQRGNLALNEDNSGNRKFTKPKDDDYRKIDGWSALANLTYVMMSEGDMYPGQVLSIKV